MEKNVIFGGLLSISVFFLFLSTIIFLLYIKQLVIIAQLMELFGTLSVWWHLGCLQIITVAFLLFLAPAEGSNLAGQSLILTWPTLTYKKLLKPIMSSNRRGPLIVLTVNNIYLSKLFKISFNIVYGGSGRKPTNKNFLRFCNHLK